jgi:ABC-type dipeptide/oligopeptide/nickel transport system permease component
MKILRYILRRVAIAIPQLIGITIAVFLLIRLMPADPVARLLGMFSTENAYRMAQEKLGLDKPLYEQFWVYFSGMFRGDLGTSWVTGEPITKELRQFFPITLELILLAFGCTLIVAIPLGMVTALRPGGFWDRFALVWGLFAGAQPEFWWGLVFAFLLYYKAGWFPAPLGRISSAIQAPPTVTGMLSVDSILAGNWPALKDFAKHAALPVLTFFFILSGPFVKMTRQSMVNVLKSDFMMYVHASGLKGFRVVTYALRNAIAPVVTLIGILFGWMIGGAVLIETVFSWGGLGQYAVRSTLMFDYPAIQGVILTITAWSLAVYIVLDIVYKIIDPRIEL